jgi:hypothetical protein
MVFIVYVDGDLMAKNYPSSKTVIIPEALDSKILEHCQKYGLSRSEFIRNSVIEQLKRVGEDAKK